MTVDLLWTYIPPCLCMIGLVGNSLVFVVLCKSSMRKTTSSIKETTSLYLRFLAVFDTLALFTGLLGNWILIVFHYRMYDIRTHGVTVYVIHSWLSFCSADISSWLLMSVTLERCVSVLYPHRVKVICTKRNTCITILCIIFVFSLLSAGIVYSRVQYYARISNDTYTWANDVYYEVLHAWPWYEFSVYNLIPSSVLIVCNICIIYKVVSSSRRVPQNDSTNQRRGRSSRQSQSTSLTVMLVVTSVTYVICTTPYWLCRLLRQRLVGLVGLDSFHLILTLAEMLRSTNHCVNFILYCVSGKLFREELWDLCSCVKRRQFKSERAPRHHV